VKSHVRHKNAKRKKNMDVAFKQRKKFSLRQLTGLCSDSEDEIIKQNPHNVKLAVMQGAG
jgi:hypothetical protein